MPWHEGQAGMVVQTIARLTALWTYVALLRI